MQYNGSGKAALFRRIICRDYYYKLNA